jgi:hypothetical protein
MRLSRLTCLSLIVGGLCLHLCSLVAQNVDITKGQLITKDQENQFLKLKFPFDSKVLKGEETFTLPQIELAARFYVYRVTYVPPPAEAVMANYVKEFENMISIAANPNNTKANRELINKFAPQLVTCFKEVFELDFNDNRLAQVNGAVMLPQFAKLKHDAIGDFLAIIVADEKKHDAVRVHAAKALHEFFPVKAFTKFDLNNNQALERKARDKKRVDALLTLIDRPMPKTTDPYEIDALSYVRRAAVTTLAMAQTPAISALDKKAKVEGPVALGLIKVLSKKIEPEPSLKERIAAAAGVCQFTKYVDEYDPKIGIYLVGETLSDVVNEYKRDYNNIAAKAKDKKPTTLYWKETPKMLEAALTDLVNNSRGTPNAAAVQALDAATRPVLKNIYNFDPIDREQQFRDAVQKLRPNTKAIFRSGTEALVEFDWTPAAPAEEKQADGM